MIQFNGANEGLSVAAVIAGGNDMTVCGGVRLDATPSGDQIWLNLGQTDFGPALSFGMFNGAVYVYHWGASAQLDGPTLVNGDELWYAFTKAGNTGNFYWRVNGGSRNNDNGTMADQTYGTSQTLFGRYDTTTNRIVGSLSAHKMWDGVALGTTDLDSEWQYRDALTNLGSLWGNWRLNTLTADADGYNDRSGNVRNLTVGGTLGAVSDPTWILGNSPSGGPTQANFNETISLADGIGLTYTADSLIQRNFGETISLADTVGLRVHYRVIDFSESISLGTVERSSLVLELNLQDETITLFDTIGTNQQAAQPSANLNELISLLDAVNWRLTLTQPFVEQITLSDTFGLRMQVSRNFDEVITMRDIYGDGGGSSSGQRAWASAGWLKIWTKRFGRWA